MTDRPEEVAPDPVRRAVPRVHLNDVFGTLALFVLLVLGFWVAYGAGLPTGGHEMMREMP